MLTLDYRHTINFWITGLSQYNFVQLCLKPSPESWSIGQLYIHLINDTNFYIEQIKNCIAASGKQVNSEAKPAAKAMFKNNHFPDERIQGSPENASLPQPLSKEALLKGLQAIRAELESLSHIIEKNKPVGKTMHPGLGYFTAAEWLQFAEMHFRHHIKQK